MLARLRLQLTSTHLLRNHDSPRSQSSATNTRNGEKFDESGDIVALSDDG